MRSGTFLLSCIGAMFHNDSCRIGRISSGRAAKGELEVDIKAVVEHIISGEFHACRCVHITSTTIFMYSFPSMLCSLLISLSCRLTCCLQQARAASGWTSPAKIACCLVGYSRIAASGKPCEASLHRSAGYAGNTALLRCNCS